MSSGPEGLDSVLDGTDLSQEVGNGTKCVGEVRVGCQMIGGSLVHVVVNSGALTLQLLNVQHLQSFPTNQPMLMDGLFHLFYRVRDTLIRERLDGLSKTFGN